MLRDEKKNYLFQTKFDREAVTRPYRAASLNSWLEARAFVVDHLYGLRRRFSTASAYFAGRDDIGDGAVGFYGERNHNGALNPVFTCRRRIFYPGRYENQQRPVETHLPFVSGQLEAFLTEDRHTFSRGHRCIIYEW